MDLIIINVFPAISNFFLCCRYMDKKLLLKLNGGRSVSGYLRGFDPFMNVVIDETEEHLKDNTKNKIGMVVSFSVVVFFLDVWILLDVVRLVVFLEIFSYLMKDIINSIKNIQNIHITCCSIKGVFIYQVSKICHKSLLSKLLCRIRAAPKKILENNHVYWYLNLS